MVAMNGLCSCLMVHYTMSSSVIGICVRSTTTSAKRILSDLKVRVAHLVTQRVMARTRASKAVGKTVIHCRVERKIRSKSTAKSMTWAVATSMTGRTSAS